MNSNDNIEVIAPSRLHFGLLSFGHAQRQFGGAGAMVEKPGLRLRFSPARRLEAVGGLRERVVQFARRFAAFHHLPSDPPYRIEVLHCPPQHTGLGVGTALGMAVAAGLHKLLALGPPTPEGLAQSVGRGRRSAVGVHGFFHGGLIAEAGKCPGDVLAPLIRRVELPADWRFVLICPPDEAGLSGANESDAFGRLPPVPEEVTRRLRHELDHSLLPAAADGDYGRFSESLYRFGHLAGECFAAGQHGAYATPRLAELVELIRSLGVRGVGQSSWGPTLYAGLPDAAAAEELVAELQTYPLLAGCDLTISAPDSRGGVHRFC